METFSLNPRMWGKSPHHHHTSMSTARRGLESIFKKSRVYYSVPDSKTSWTNPTYFHSQICFEKDDMVAFQVHKSVVQFCVRGFQWFEFDFSKLNLYWTCPGQTSWAKAMYLSQSNNFVLRIMVWLIFWSSAVLYRRLSLVVWSLFFQQVMSALNESRTKVSWMKAPGSALSITNFSWQKALQTKEMPPCLHKSYVCSCLAILLLAEVLNDLCLHAQLGYND